MSAVFGILNLDGRPVEIEDLECMQRSMAHWGPQGTRIWHQGPVGLGSLLLHSTAESQIETLPLQSQDGRTVLTAAARLDNRDELSRQFGVSAAECALLPDSTLILMAYERWGKQCPQHLLGDWVLAVWDATLQQLFLARDHFGTGGLFYYREGQSFAFASSIKGLLSLPGMPRRLNLASLGGANLRTDASTPYQGVFKLTPAQALLITPEKTELWHYWRLQDIPDVRLGSDEAYAAAFLEIYDEAVRCRLRSHRPVGLMLSGGLDSGSIAVLAGQQLAAKGQNLLAYSALPLYAVSEAISRNRSGDESPFIESTCRVVGNIDLTYIKGESFSLVEAIKLGVEIYDLPFVNANHIWLLELMARAKRDQVGVMLDGWGGNFTVSWTGNRERYLRDLLAGGQWRAFGREVRSWARLNHTPVWKDIIRQVLAPVWKEQQDRLGVGRMYLLKTDWNRTLQKQYPGRVIDLEANRSLNPGLYHYYRNGQNILSSLQAAYFGMEARQPTMDKRLIEFCMGIPHDQFIRDGQEKMLIRRAMAGRLPEDVLWTTRRGLQSADIAQRVLAGEEEICETLLTLHASPIVNRYLSLSHAEQALRTIREQPGSQKALATAGQLTKILSTGLFLQRFADAS